MAKAGAILAATLDLLEGKIRPGVSTAELDQAAERFNPFARRGANVQWLSRLSRLDLRLAERGGRARDSGPLPPRARRHNLDRCGRDARRVGRGRRTHISGGGDQQADAQSSERD